MDINEAAEILFGIKPKTTPTYKCFHGCGDDGVVPIWRCAPGVESVVVGAECYKCLKARQVTEAEQIDEERNAIALERGE